MVGDTTVLWTALFVLKIGNYVVSN